MPSIPSPLRAALGLAASAVEGIRTLPDKAVELPTAAMSTALQYSLKAQQRYADLVARGDALLSRPSVTDEPPAWASFDDEADAEERASITLVEDVSGRDAPAPSKFDTVIFDEDEDEDEVEADEDKDE